MNIGQLVASIGADVQPLRQAVAEAESRMNQASQRMTTSFQKFENTLKSVGQTLRNTGRQMSMYITAPLVGVATAAFKMAKDFEKAMQTIVGLVGIAQEQVTEWGKEILQMAPALGRAPKELADALFFVTSAGMRDAAAMDVLKISAKAAVAGLGETKVVADLVTSAVNAYGEANLSAASAVDILVAAVREGKAEAPELTASMGMVLPIAAEMEVHFSEVAAAIAAMTRTGTDASMASTALRGILAALLKPSKQAEDALKGMGTSSAEFRREIREKGLLSALMTLRKLTSEYGEEMMAQVVPNVRALAGVLDLMGANLEDNIKVFDGVRNSLGDADRAYKVAAETAETTWQQAMQSSKVALIAIGDVIKDSIIPILKGFTNAMVGIANWFSNLSKAQQKWILVIAGTVAVLGPLLIMLGFMMTTVIPGLIKLFISLRLATLKFNLVLAATRVQLTKLAAMLAANPFGVAVLGVAALIYALSRLKRGTDAVTQSMNELNRKTKQAVAGERVELDKLIAVLNDNTRSVEQRQEALENLIKLAPEYFGHLRTEKVNIERVNEALNDYTIASRNAQTQIEIYTKLAADAGRSDRAREGALGRLRTTYQQFGYDLKGVVLSFENVEQVAAEFTQTLTTQQKEIKGLLGVLEDSNSTRTAQLEAIEKLNKIHKDTLGNIQLEVVNMDKLTEAIHLYIEALEKKAKASAAQEMLETLEKRRIQYTIEYEEQMEPMRQWRQRAQDDGREVTSNEERRMQAVETAARNRLNRQLAETERMRKALMGIVVEIEFGTPQEIEISKQIEQELETTKQQFISLGKTAEDAALDAARTLQSKYTAALQDVRAEISGAKEDEIDALRTSETAHQIRLQGIGKYLGALIQEGETRAKLAAEAAEAAKKERDAEIKRLAGLGDIGRLEEKLQAAKDGYIAANSTAQRIFWANEITSIQSTMDEVNKLISLYTELNQLRLPSTVEGGVSKGAKGLRTRPNLDRSKVAQGTSEENQIKILGNLWNALDAIEQKESILGDLYDGNSEKVNEYLTAINLLIEDGYEKNGEAINNLLELLKGQFDSVQEKVMAVAEVMAQVLSSAFNAALISGENFFKVLLKGVGDLVKKLLAAAAAAAVVSGIMSALGLGSFKGMFKGLFGKMIGLKEGGVITKPTTALVGEYAGASSNPEIVSPLNKLNKIIEERAVPGTVFAKLKPADFSGLPRFAEGGIVDRPTMGLMGEYPGANRNPEVIAPLDRLQDILKRLITPTIGFDAPTIRDQYFGGIDGSLMGLNALKRLKTGSEESGSGQSKVKPRMLQRIEEMMELFKARIQQQQQELPAFAQGAVIKAPTIGMVGEYPGVRSNPEVIAPLDKLQELFGKQEVSVDVNVKGQLTNDVIYISNERFGRHKTLIE